MVYANNLMICFDLDLWNDRYILTYNYSGYHQTSYIPLFVLKQFEIFTPCLNSKLSETKRFLGKIILYVKLIQKIAVFNHCSRHPISSNHFKQVNFSEFAVLYGSRISNRKINLSLGKLWTAALRLNWTN